jgi:phage tail-like protein
MADLDPYRNYNFKLEIQGVTQGHFTECSGLGARVEAISYREGGLQQVVRRLPGRTEYADVTLRYGLTSSNELWQWLLSVIKGTVQRRNVSVILLGSDGSTEVMRWNLVNVWPREWRGAPLDAMGQEVAIETMTLVYESLERG